MNLTSITHSVSGRIAAGAVGVAMAIALIGAAAPVSAAALTSAQVSAIISLLQSFGADAATIANVQASLTGGTPVNTGGTGGACPVLSRDLQLGSSGSDVKSLQQYLNSSATTQVASAGAGSPGNESTYFGSLTKAAVMKFQSANGVSPVAGYVGPITRAAITAVCGKTGGTTPPPTPTGPGLTVTAAAQPANSLAPQGTSRVPFTTFTLTNNTSAAVTVSSVTVQRTGLAADAVFSGVVLLDSNGLQVGTARTFNSNHQSNIGDNFVLNAGTSVTFTVAGNMAADLSTYAGQVASLQVVAINTSVPVSGSLPITGASQTINSSLTVGSVSTTTSSVVPPTSTTHTQNIGDTGVRFSGLKFTAGSTEDLKMYSIRWRQTGTASASDISNITTYANGVAYAATVSSDGKYYTTVFPGGILITKGSSLDVYVQGDLTGNNAASRTVQFNVDKVTDVYFVGQLYGYGIAPSGTSQPWYTGDIFSLSAGTASSIQKSTTSADAAQNIAVNVSDQPFGGFVTNFLGEPVQVTTVKISIATSSGFTGNGPITGIKIIDNNGNVVAGPIDEAASNTSGTALSFPDTITFPVGSATYHIKGKIPSGVTNGSTLTVTVNPTTWTGVTGQTSGNTVSLSSNSSFTLNQMTVRGATTTLTVASSPASQNFVAGGTPFTFANFQLDASQSGENIRLSSLALYPTLGTAGDKTYVTNCQLYDGTSPINTGSRVVNSITTATAATFTFDNALVVPKGTIKTLALKCNVSSGITSGASHTIKWGIDTATTYTATGVTSGTSITVSVAATANGGTMTPASASMTVTVDASSPSYKLVAAGSTGVTVGIVKVRATNEAISLRKLGLTLTAPSGATASNGAGATTHSGVDDVLVVKIYQAGNPTPVGTASFTGTNTTATSTLDIPVLLAKDADTLLTLKADLANIGVSDAGGIGDVVKIDPLNAEGTGESSGTTAQSGATAGVSGIQIFKGYPTLASGPATPTNPNGTGVALKKFSVTASAGGNGVGLHQVAVSLATSSATVRNLKLFAYTGSDYTGPANVSGTTNGQFGGTATLSAPLDIASPTVSFTQATALTVGAGSTMYFTLTGDVTPGSTATNWTITSTVLGDTATSSSPAGYNATTTPGRTSAITGVATTTTGSNFIWSDNATTTATATDVDWFSGYYVPGLSSSGF